MLQGRWINLEGKALDSHHTIDFRRTEMFMSYYYISLFRKLKVERGWLQCSLSQ